VTADPGAAPVTLPRAGATTQPSTPPEAAEGPAVPSTAGNTTSSEAAADPVENFFPDVDVIEIATGETVNMQSLVAIDRPVLLWFWAPH
jgi:hypothetical protein